MKRYWLREDKLPPNLLVNFSSKITEKINAIGNYNKNNDLALTQWSDYLDGIKSYLSKSVIAWDNMNRYPRLRSGGKFIKDFGYNVGYTLLNDYSTNKPLVYIFMVNLKVEEFGLRLPPNMNEDKHDIISRIVSETINNYLKRNLLLVS